MSDTETEERASRSQMWKHEDFVEWATEEGLITAKSTQAEVIAAFAGNRNRWRKTERYQTLVASHAEEAEEAAAARKAEREAAKEAKAAERAKAKEEKAAAAKAKAETEKAPAKAPAKKTAAAKKGAAAKGGDDNPFD